MIYAPYLSASAIDRYLACSGSAHLARVSSESAAAQAGTDQHEERLHPERFPENLVRWFGVMPKFEEAYGVDSDCHSDGSGAAPAFFGAYTGRNYPCPGPGWIVGSADARHCTSTTISVGDLKTGRAQLGGSLGKPQSSGQLRTLAYLLLRYGQSVRPGWHPSRVRLAWFLDDGENVAIDDAEITVDGLRSWGDDLLARARRTRGNLVPTLSPGPSCDYCPCFDACPAMGGAIRRILEMEAGAPLSGADAIEAFSLASRAKRAAESARDAISTLLKRGEISNDTHTLRLTSRKTRTIDPVIGLPALETAIAASGFGAEEARAIAAKCLSTSLTGESIRRGLGIKNIEPIMEALTDAGAVVLSQSAEFPSLIKRR